MTVPRTVKPTTPTPTAPPVLLASTGSVSGPGLIIGGALLGVGALMALAGRRPRKL